MRNSTRVVRLRALVRALWAIPPALLASSATALAGGPYFSEGTYVGRGECKRNSGLGETFEARWRFSGWDVEVHYEGGKHGSKEDPRVLRTGDRGYGLFDVSIAGRHAGDGYCTRPLCHLELTVDGRREEWNLAFREGAEERLLVARSVRDAAGLRVCEEELRLEPPAPGP